MAARMVEVVLMVWRWCSGDIEQLRRLWWESRLWWALVTLGEKPKCVDLMYEIGHTSPPAKPEPNNQHPNHHECVDNICSDPSPSELRRLLHRILQQQNSFVQFMIIKNRHLTCGMCQKDCHKTGVVRIRVRTDTLSHRMHMAAAKTKNLVPFFFFSFSFLPSSYFETNFSRRGQFQRQYLFQKPINFLNQH